MEPIDSLATSDWFKDYDSIFEMFDEEMQMGAVEAAALNEAASTWSSPMMLNPYETATTYYAAMAPPATPLSDYYYTAATFAATTAPPPSNVAAPPPLPEIPPATQLVAPATTAATAVTVASLPAAAKTSSTTATVATTSTTATATLVPTPLLVSSTQNLCHQGITYHYATALTSMNTSNTITNTTTSSTACTPADSYDLSQFFNQYHVAPQLLASSTCDNTPLIIHCNSASTNAVTDSSGGVASAESPVTNSDGALSPHDGNKCRKKLMRCKGTSLLAQPSPKTKQLSRLELMSRLCVQAEHNYASEKMPAPNTTTTTSATPRTQVLLIHK